MSIEESIKVLGEIAEGFEKLSTEMCARNDLRALWEGRAKGIRQAIAVIKAHMRVQPNDPLTLEKRQALATKERSTRAERLRLASDEEMARVMDESFACPPDDKPCPGRGENCLNCWLNWLHEPVKGD